MGLRRTAAAVTLATASALLVTACGSAQQEPVRDAAQQFYAALAAGDGATACAALAPPSRTDVERVTQASCEQGVLGLSVPQVAEPRAVRVYGAMAQVRYERETAFLTRFDDRWLVLAAGCSPQPSGSYDCQVEGG
jgi:hypothetical protein